MAPSDLAAIGRNRKIRSVIDFANDFLAKIPIFLDGSSTDALLADVNHHIHSLNAPFQKARCIPSEVAKELKDCGKRLWNECIREKRTNDNSSLSVARSQLFVRVRVFAFLILVLARQSHAAGMKETEEHIMQLLNLALIVGRVCIEGSDLDGARLGLHKVGDYVERLKAIDGGCHDDLATTKRLESQYLTMRMALAWKEDRLDVAEHMYSKAEALRHHLDPSSAEHMANTLHHIGSDLSSKSDLAMALKWLRRGYELINSQEVDQLSTQSWDLRLAIYHDLIQVLLTIGSPEHIQEADDLVGYVETEIGDKPIVLHWKLELMHKSPEGAFNTEACASILRRMIRSADYSDVVIGFLLHNIKELRDRSFKLATALLDELLITKILPLNNTEWTGKTIIRRIWMATMEAETSEGPNDLSTLFDKIPLEPNNLLKPDVTAAAQSLIWKKIESIYVQNQYKAAAMWCQLALHPLFANCGDTNKGKLGRKLILCSINCGDTETAKSAFEGMPTLVRDDPLTRYLMFKTSLLQWDHEFGCECIEHLSKCSDKEKSQEILYACVQEAQQFGDRLCALAALKAVVEKCALETTSKVHLTSIMRCTIRLVHQIEDQEGEISNNGVGLVEDTCHMFERGRTPEIRMDLCHLIRIFISCIGFIQCYPQDIAAENRYDVQLTAMRCHFIVSAALVSQARTEDNIEEQLQRYLEMRGHIATFDAVFESAFREEPGSTDEQALGDMLAKAATLFVFDFEGAVCLRSWEDLSQVVRKAKMCKDELMYKAMGDCLLRSRAPGNVLYATMRLIINEIFELEKFDIQRLAQYLRCIFMAVLPLDDSLALQVAEQALQIAREGHQVEKFFPADELDWLVATTFNHAIDILARGDKALYHQWALKALDLAEYMNDSGYMRNFLHERIIKLGFGKDE